MLTLTWDGWLTLAVIAIVFICLVRNLAPPDVVMLGSAVFLGLTGVITPELAFSGFVNPGVLTIAALFVVAAAVRETGALDTYGQFILGKTRTERGVLARLAVFVIPISAFLNNTPVVAMLVPMLSGWGRRMNISPSRLLIPLSYFAILGGACTLIGTSTNIVVDGLLTREQGFIKEQMETALPERIEELTAKHDALGSIGMFELTKVGLPFSLIGVAYLLFIGTRLLPSRSDASDSMGEESRKYLIDMRIQSDCRLVGQSVEAAGLRQLPGLFLIAIFRDNKSIAPVRPDEVLEADDILTFTGVVNTIVDLERIPGLVPVADEQYEEHAAARREHQLCEAVISSTSPLIGTSIRDADFRALYNAAIVAVHRGGHRLQGRVGDIRLKNGDTLLLQAGPHFTRAHQNNPDFYLVGGVEESRALRNDRQLIAMGIVGVMVVLMATEIVTPVFATALAVVLLIATQCISPALARQALDLQTILTIAGAFGLGAALEQTGAAREIAGLLVNLTQTVPESIRPWGLLIVIYLLTAIFTETITTKGAAVLMFPLAIEAAGLAELNPRTLVMAVLFASIASFATPLGYQTNLMVWGPGRYKYTDYIKVGLPLALILMIAATFLIPFAWPF